MFGGKDRDHRASGFTLLEIIVALVVFGFLIVALNAGARTGFALWNAQARRAGQTEELDATARVLRTMLNGLPLLPVTAAENAPRAIGFKGEPDRLIAVGDMPTGFGGSQLADVTLRLNQRRLVLDWTPHRHEQAGSAAASPSTETELMGGVERLEFGYFGSTVPGAPGLWATRWDGPAMPLLIRLRLSFAKGDPRRWPDLIVAPQLAPP